MLARSLAGRGLYERGMNRYLGDASHHRRGQEPRVLLAMSLELPRLIAAEVSR